MKRGKKKKNYKEIMQLTEGRVSASMCNYIAIYTVLKI